MLQASQEFLGAGVCAADLAGAEASYPMSGFLELFEKVRQMGMPFTIHAGECGNAKNIADAVEAGASRIGLHYVICKSRFHSVSLQQPYFFFMDLAHLLDKPQFFCQRSAAHRPVICMDEEKDPEGCFMRLGEASNGKDTMTGHWEMMGIKTFFFPT